MSGQPKMGHNEALRRERYLNDPVYHAKVYAAAQWLADWDFRKGADMEREFYVEQAMELIEVVEAVLRSP